MKQFLLAFDKFLEKLSKAAAILAGIFILATAFIIVYEVIMRGLFHSPTEWVLEISTYFIITAGFLGLAITFRQKAHIQVDLFASKLSKKNSRNVNLCLNLLAIFTFLIFMTESMDQVTASFVYHKLSPSILRFPLYIPQFALVLGSALLLGEIIRRFLFDLLCLPDMPTPLNNTGKSDKEAR